jgi:hypothetical protein
MRDVRVGLFPCPAWVGPDAVVWTPAIEYAIGMIAAAAFAAVLDTQHHLPRAQHQGVVDDARREPLSGSVTPEFGSDL